MSAEVVKHKFLNKMFAKKDTKYYASNNLSIKLNDAQRRWDKVLILK